MNAAKDESDFRNLVLQVLLIANARQSKSYNQNVEIYTQFYAKCDQKLGLSSLFTTDVSKLTKLYVYIYAKVGGGTVEIVFQ